MDPISGSRERLGDAPEILRHAPISEFDFVKTKKSMDQDNRVSNLGFHLGNQRMLFQRAASLAFNDPALVLFPMEPQIRAPIEVVTFT